MNKTIKKLDSIIAELISQFEKKHEVEFDYWIANQTGEVAVFGDYFLNFSDIRYDLEFDIPKDKILDWYNESIDAALCEKKFPNFQNYCKINGKNNSGFDVDWETYEKNKRKM